MAITVVTAIPSPVAGTFAVTPPAVELRGAAFATTAAIEEEEGVSAGLGLGVDVGPAVAEARSGAGDDAAALISFGIGWIDTYFPSQTMGFGSYFQGVK